MTNAATPQHRLAIPWGPDATLPLAIPSDWNVVGVAWPDLASPILDYAAALEHALDQPEGGVEAGLPGQLEPGMKVAIVVDDPSRWTPVREALPILLGRLLNAGIEPSDVSISVGVGRHAAVDARAMALRVGENVARTYTCHSPPVDDLSAYVDLGTTSEGVPVRVFGPVARADLRILVGSVLPHLQAGFGGGFKLIFPGTSHRSTLVALHRKGLGADEAGRLLGGHAAENPMRQAIALAAAKLGPCVSVSHLLGPPGTVLEVATGRPEGVQDRLASEAARRFRAREVNSKTIDIVIAGNHPWPGDPMQSFKVLLQHRSAGRPGGVLAGFFWTDAEEIDRSMPLGALQGIARTGSVGGWVIRRGLAAADRVASAVHAPSEFLIRWARELVVDRTVLVYAPPLFERVGPRLGPVRLFDDVGALWDAAARALPGVSRPGCRIFPQGGLTYCPMAGV